MNVVDKSHWNELPRRRRPPTSSAMMTLYAIGGCATAVSLIVGHVGITFVIGAAILLVMAALRPHAVTAASGAVVFTLAPAILIALLTALIAIDSGNGVAMLAALFILFAACVVVLPIGLAIVLIGAALGVGLFPVADHIPGYCDNCDYNLRGLTSGRCPECGMACNLGEAAP